MGTILASAIISRAQTILQDVGAVRWTTLELLDWLNDAQREIVTLRPGANAKSVSVQLAAGTKQTIPTDGIVFMDVIRNMGTDGTTPGSPVRPTTRFQLDTQLPTWHTDPTLAEIEHFWFDPQLPKVFWVYPQSDGSHRVELQYAAVPTVIANTSTAIGLDDIYANVMLDGVLYRAFSKDTEHEGNEARAAAHRMAFENTLGLKAEADGSSAAVNSPGKK
jgi:hypothetical protein